jgi:hypothetical protein
MTDLTRVRSVFSGFPGGDGVATMYFLDNATCVASVRSFWDSVKGFIPRDVTIHVDNAGDTIDEVTGDLTGTWLSPVEDDVHCTSNDAYAAPVGGLVTWKTNGLVAGHRVKGRTFLVPISSSCFDLQGNFGGIAQAAIKASADSLIGAQSASFVVWHRPFAGKSATATKPAQPRRDGGHALIVASVVPPRAAVLRSRRP